jgi:hypothetical protein
MVNFSGKMVHITKVNTCLVKSMEMVNLNIPMAKSTKVFGHKGNKMVKVFLSTKTDKL